MRRISCMDQRMSDELVNAEFRLSVFALRRIVFGGGAIVLA